MTTKTGYRWTALVIGVAGAALSAATLPAPALAQAGASAQAASQRVPLSVYGAKPFMFAPALSPDGRRIAVRLAHKGTDHLAIVDLEDPKAQPQFILSAGELRDAGDRTFGGYRWVGNDHLVITLASREAAGGRRFDLTRLSSYDLRTRKLTPLAWDSAGYGGGRILNINHDQAKILVERDSTQYSVELLGVPEVAEIDVASGAIRTIRKPSAVMGSYFVDRTGAVRAAAGGNRDTGEETLYYRSNGDGVLKAINKVIDKDFVGAGIQPAFFLDEPDMVLATDNSSGFRRLYKVNLRDPSQREVVFESKGFDVGGVILSPDRQRVIGYTVQEDRDRQVFTDELVKTAVGLFEQQFGKGNVGYEGMSHDNRRILMSVGKPSQAGAYYLYDTQTGNVRQIGWARDALKGQELNPVSTIRYRASDGETVPAVVTMPRHRAGQKNLPVLVMPHGGPFGVRDVEEFGYFPWAQAMAEQGYVVVQPNYRGSGGYGNDWVKKGRAEGFGLRMQDDLNDAVTHLAAQGIVDPSRACMMGWSYGGYASARAAQRDGAKYRCAIAGAGVYHLAQMRTYDRDYLGRFGMNYLSKGEADLASVSPAMNGGGQWAPILIVHGYKDSRVPVEQAKTLVSALRRAGKREGVDFRYIEQKENTHNFPYEADHIQWLTEAAKWMEQHNPAYAPSDADYARKPA